MTAFDQSAAAASTNAVDASAPRLELADRQWLLTDGLGGYATGNGMLLPRRRYDSLLTVLAGNGRRVRLWAGVDDRMLDRLGEHALMAAHWQALAAPSLPAANVVYRPAPVPTWTLRAGEGVVERSVVMTRGTAATTVVWRNVGPAPFELHIRPLLAGEDADALRFERDGCSASGDGPITFAFGDLAEGAVMSWAGPAEWRSEPCWYRAFHFAADAARGYDATADRWAPGVFVVGLRPGQEFALAVGLGQAAAEPKALATEGARQRGERRAWAERASSGLAQRLRRGVDDFLYRAPGGRLGVLAGFPWFGEWGRDVFVALPGLTLAVDEPERCREVLRGALPFLRRGLLPNIYGPTPAASQYNSADAALWFSLCVRRWHAAGAATEAVRAEFGAALRQIAESYLDGAELGLRVDGDGLLSAGSREHNATWMDAETSRGPVTPRDGQPVEIVALWCALLQHLGQLFGEPWQQRAVATGRAFAQQFWRADAGCLFDRRIAGRGDPAVRPNMILAAALPDSPLSPAQRQSIVAVAERQLLTARGLRTLAPRDPAYRGRYEGGPEQRDAAYHQGTVWPWLGGFHVEAALRAAPAAELATVRARLLAWLQGFEPEVDRGGGDHLSEVFDGDAPQRAGGTFAQAWNTGELLRAVRLCREYGA